MTDSPEMNNERRDSDRPKGDRRAHTTVPDSKALAFLAKQLQKQGNPSIEHHIGALAEGMKSLFCGEYPRPAASIEQSAQILIELPLTDLPKLEQSTSLLIKNALRELADQHLNHGDLLGTLRALDLSLAFARKQTGDHRGEITTLSFERVLAFKLIREQQGASNPALNQSYLDAIIETRRMALQEGGGITSNIQGHILTTLGKSLFYAGMWDEAAYTLVSGLRHTIDPNAKASSFGMLAQIAHYKGEREEALQYIRELRMIPGVLTPDLEALATDIANATNQSRDNVDPPELRCIKETLHRGFVLLEQEKLIAAQSALEGALAQIEHQYGPRHYLVTTALALLSKALADQGTECADDEMRETLYKESRDYALRGYDILKDENVDRERQKQLLGFAYAISEELNDHAEVARLGGMLDSDLF